MDIFRYPPEHRRQFRRALLLAPLVALGCAAIATFGSASRIEAVFFYSLALLFATSAAAIHAYLRRTDSVWRVDAQAISWESPAGQVRRRISWSEVVEVRHRPLLRQVELLDCSGRVLCSLDRSLAEFEQLHEMVRARIPRA